MPLVGMPLKDLLVYFDRSDAGYARLELAFNLARACRAYLAGAYVLPEAGSGGFGLARPAGMTGLAEDGVSSGGVASGALRAAEAAESAEQHFKSKLRLHGVEGEWHLLADGDSAALIELADVGMTYQAASGPVEALAGISLSVGAGEFVSLVGPSGCGKSTLLRIVAGLRPSTRG